ATAMKTTAATRRQSAPRPSRIFAPEAAAMPVRRGAAAGGTGKDGRPAVFGAMPGCIGRGEGACWPTGPTPTAPTPAATGPAVRAAVELAERRRSSVTRLSALVRVRNSSWATEPLSVVWQEVQVVAFRTMRVRQTGQASVSAYRNMGPSFPPN